MTIFGKEWFLVSFIALVMANNMQKLFCNYFYVWDFEEEDLGEILSRITKTKVF